MLTYQCCPAIVNNTMMGLMQRVMEQGGALLDQAASANLLFQVAMAEVEKALPSAWDAVGHFFLGGKNLPNPEDSATLMQELGAEYVELGKLSCSASLIKVFRRRAHTRHAGFIVQLIV